MPKFNDFDMKNWKDLNDVLVDSLWIIDKRKKDEFNSNNFHGNFVPQLPEQFIKRYTKTDDIVLDPFIGSGTTIYEASKLNRKCIGVDLTPTIFDLIRSKNIDSSLYSLIEGDSLNKKTKDIIQNELENKYHKEKVQLIIYHPPYYDIIKFSDKKEDLSNCTSVNDFLKKFSDLLDNTLPLLEDNRYCILVIGDKYENLQLIPLSFYCMQIFQNKGLILKGNVVKNCINTKAKSGNESIWRYRALNSDYFVFKHEYIFVFKKSLMKKKA